MLDGIFVEIGISEPVSKALPDIALLVIAADIALDAADRAARTIRLFARPARRLKVDFKRLRLTLCRLMAASDLRISLIRRPFMARTSSRLSGSLSIARSILCSAENVLRRRPIIARELPT